jgi:hypothetical protein
VIFDINPFFHLPQFFKIAGLKEKLIPVSLSRIDLDIDSILFGARTGRGPAMGTTIVEKVAIGKDKE